MDAEHQKSALSQPHPNIQVMQYRSPIPTRRCVGHVEFRAALDQDVDHGQTALLGGQVQRRVSRRVRRLVDDRSGIARAGQPLDDFVALVLGDFSKELHRRRRRLTQ